MPDDLLDRLKIELARPPFNAWLKPEPVSATANGVEIRLHVRPEMAGGTDPDFVHGGIIAALIDLVGYAAAACATGRTVPTVGLQIDYLRPAISGVLHANALVRHRSRKLVRVDVEIRTAEEKIVALGRGTFTIVEEKT